MKKYKFSVSKGQNKYTIVVSGETPEEAKEKVHNEWYSILSVEEFVEWELQWEKFMFQILDPVSKEVKLWVIIGTDIFKIYLKLRKDLGYQVLSLFSEKDKNIEQSEKDKIMSDLKEQFEIFESTGTTKKVELEQKIDVKNAETVIDGFHLKKELDDTYKLIEFVLKKLQTLIEDTNKFTISTEKREKLKEVYNNIIKIKKTTNVSKLKQVWEIALVKIGQIELDNIENYQKEDARDLLKETNSLLKQIGSKENFIEESKDIKKILQNFINSWSETFSKLKNLKELFKSRKTDIDKTSYSYLKTLVLLSKYEQRLSQNTKEILSNFSVFLFPLWQNLEKREYILLKRKVIKQNISLLTAKKSGKVYSYTFIKKWYTSIVGSFFHFLLLMKWYIFWIVYLYSFCFICLLNFKFFELSFLPEINFIAVLYFVFFILLFLVISLSKNLFSLAINFVFFSFLFIFGVVNF